MPKCIKPISIFDFPENVRTNCFGFAIGDTESIETLLAEEKFNIDNSLPIAEAFLKKLGELGYDELPRQIFSLDEALPSEYVLMLFDFTPYKIRIPFMDEYETLWDFHVVRRELNGSWVHKPGWKDKPCEICTETDWKAIYKEFGRKYVLFAVTAN